MNFAVRLLDNVCNVNDFQEVETIELIRGNPYTLYFKVVQPNKDNLRYIPVSTPIPATGLAKFKHLEDGKSISRAATNPFPEDTSIWSIPILPTDEIQFDSMTFQLTEGTGPSQKVYIMNVDGDIVTVDTDSRKNFC